MPVHATKKLDPYTIQGESYEGFRNWLASFNKKRSARITYDALAYVANISTNDKRELLPRIALEACYHASIWDEQGIENEDNLNITNDHKEFLNNADHQRRMLRNFRKLQNDNFFFCLASEFAFDRMQTNNPEFFSGLNNEICASDFVVELITAMDGTISDIKQRLKAKGRKEWGYMCFAWDKPRELSTLAKRPSVDLALMFNLVHLFRQFTSREKRERRINEVRRSNIAMMPKAGTSRPCYKQTAIIVLSTLNNRTSISDKEIEKLIGRLKTFLKNNPSVRLRVWPTQEFSTSK
ncbi:MAG: hypothetical protein R3F41_10090 [Gammaproteobacteria bacterium]|nr:hypothetical protein [Pseudomonadales bacterium]